MPTLTMATFNPSFRVLAAALALSLLGGCGALSSLNTKPLRPNQYDLGPGGSATPPPAYGEAAARRAIALGEVDAPASVDNPAVLYRLAYADVQQQRPYGLARWSMSPPQLVRLRLRERLAQNRPVLNPGEGAVSRLLRVELEEFSQVFDAPDRSYGLVRLRATLLETTPTGEKLVAQRSFTEQRPAPSADAAGGVRALTASTDAAIAAVDQWLQETP